MTTRNYRKKLILFFILDNSSHNLQWLGREREAKGLHRQCPSLLPPSSSWGCTDSIFLHIEEW